MLNIFYNNYSLILPVFLAGIFVGHVIQPIIESLRNKNNAKDNIKTYKIPYDINKLDSDYVECLKNNYKYKGIGRNPGVLRKFKCGRLLLEDGAIIQRPPPSPSV